MSVKGIHAKKRYGQNFILDKNILSKIANAAEISQNDNILEIGAGLGTLTIELAKRAKKVVTFEIDEDVMDILRENIKVYDNVTVINMDIMKANIKEIDDEYFNGEDIKVVANLPYYITSPVIMLLLEYKFIKEITILIQKEVAQRICAKPGSKDYGVLTVSVNYRSKPEILFNLPPSVFVPQPKVESSLIKLKTLDSPPVDVIDEKLFFKIVKASFGQRRKVITNALKSTGIDKNIIDRALYISGILPVRRGETLTMQEFASVANNIYKLNNM